LGFVLDQERVGRGPGMDAEPPSAGTRGWLSTDPCRGRPLVARIRQSHSDDQVRSSDHVSRWMWKVSERPAPVTDGSRVGLVAAAVSAVPDP
jgi:hypothetical protein